MEYDIHIHWLEMAVNRLICQHKENEKIPLLSLNFAEKCSLFDPSFSFQDHLTQRDLVTGIPFAIVLNTVKTISQTTENLFSSILSTLSSLGYIPGGECTPQSLASGSKQAQVELMKLIEWAVIDKSLSIDAISSDLKRLPRSFFVLNDKPSMLDDAISLWLSKFPCSHTLPQVTDLATEIMQFQHIAFALSRQFPKRIPKDEINVGPELTDLMITKNWDLVMPVLTELNAFVPPRQRIECEHLLRLFFADVFYATRPGAKKFVRADPPPPAPLRRPHSSRTEVSRHHNHQKPAPKEEKNPPAKKGYSEKSIQRSPNCRVIAEEKPEPPPTRSSRAKSDRRHSKSHSRHKSSDTNTPSPPPVVVPKLELKGKIRLDRMPGSARPSYPSMFKQQKSRDVASDEYLIDDTNMSDSYVPPLSKSSKRKPRKQILPEEIQETKERSRAAETKHESEQEPIVVLDEDILDDDDSDYESPTYSSRSVQVHRPRAHSRHHHSRHRSHSRSHHRHRSRHEDSSSGSDEKHRHGRSRSSSRRSHRSSSRHRSHHRRERSDSESDERPPSKTFHLESLKKFAEEAGRFGASAREFSREANLLTAAQTQPVRLGDLSTEALAWCLQKCEIDDKEITADDVEKMKNTLIEFSRCSPEWQTLDNLYDLLSRKYDRSTPKAHIDYVYQLLLELLKKVVSDQSSLPHLLISIASKVFTEEEAESEIGSEMSSDKAVVADTITLTSQECETDRLATTHQETQTERGYGTQTIFDVSQSVSYESRDMDLAITDPMMLFERKDVQMESEEGEVIDPINVNISVRHVPFRRFTSFNRVMPTLRSTTILPNLRIIVTMLTFNAMPSPQYDVKRNQLISFLQGFPNDRLLILMAVMGLKMKGIYKMDKSKVSATKIWGSGPQNISEKDVGTFWKYITGTKTLEPIPTRHFTQTTDALCLKRTLEPRNW